MRGETLKTIAADYGTTLADLLAANPDVEDPDRIFPGQRLALPGGDDVSQPTPPKAKPAAPKSAPEPQESQPQIQVDATYVVMRGETLKKIAAAHGTTLTDLITANPDIDPDHIFPGQRLQLPAGDTGEHPAPVPEQSAIPELEHPPTPSTEPGDEPRPKPVEQSKPKKKTPKSGKAPKSTKKKKKKKKKKPAPTSPEPTTTHTVASGDTMKRIAAQYGVSLTDLIAANPQLPNPDAIRPGQSLVIPGTAGAPPQPKPPDPGGPAPKDPSRRAPDWPEVPEEERILYAMDRLVAYGYPVNGAAGILGNLYYESGVLPSRIEGSAPQTPLRARAFDDKISDFTAEAVMNRNEDAGRGPLKAGVGLAQWTWPTRRQRLFEYEYDGRILGAEVLFDMDAQVDFLVTELRSSTYSEVEEVVSDPAVSVDDAADAVLYGFERPGSVIGNDGKRLDRNSAAVQRVFEQRRAHARRAKDLYVAAR